MKVLPILAVLVGSALCSLEPAGYRSSSTYLPPNSRHRSSSSSSSLSSTYLPPSSRHRNTYSAAQSNYQQRSSYQRGRSTYRAPSYQPSQHYNSAPSGSSSLPSNTYIPPSPKDSYSVPEVADVRSATVPSTSYGVPEYSRALSRGYHRHNHEDTYSSEPAKYNFAYRVNDHNGNDYSHQESRDGAKTRGSYSVLLPDGRKQIVEYEADEAGYRPMISYEDVQTDRAAYLGGGPY